MKTEGGNGVTAADASLGSCVCERTFAMIDLLALNTSAWLAAQWWWWGRGMIHHGLTGRHRVVK